MNGHTILQETGIVHRTKVHFKADTGALYVHVVGQEQMYMDHHTVFINKDLGAVPMPIFNFALPYHADIPSVFTIKIKSFFVFLPNLVSS